ncbi:ATP-dependent DNA helicase RecG [Corynebacterium sp. NML140438]|uniref:ATP-dependent DNA helicase RecG n=1 Tax=Corynebacterium sp. NML140438 TaxID=1906334 RepID=UPI0008FB8822|nr:ATP-dependent DNA helicase RecG [Corynebacterium sp. NML140438]OIR42113.1 ATP-dependent DNA helicase RecG [Corynebacterium sp. NML140438]
MLGNIDPRPLNLVIPLKQAKAITKHLGYNTCGELLEHYPRRYLHYGTATDLAAINDGDTLSIVGEITATQRIPNRKHPNRPIYRTHVYDGTNTFTATFFGSNYAMRVLKEHTRVMMTGKISTYRNEIQFQHPDFVLLDGPTQATGALRQLQHFGDLETILSGREWLPIYPATKQVSTWTIMGAIHTILQSLPEIPEPLGTTPNGYISRDIAIRTIHQPDAEGPEPARQRLKYDEAMTVALAMSVRRTDANNHNAPALPQQPDGEQSRLITQLPYPLTGGQQRVIREISTDLAHAHPMSRLLQGEVGSGKTIVALISMLQAVDNGAQAALLAPTEVLAQQHARSLTETLMRAGLHTTVVPLTGSMPTAQKQDSLLKIVSGEADIVVGTHALIQDSVEFFNLGFVIVDEQHRFGVEQRDRLRAKSGDQTPHLLVMTATPIPRTIAMTVFGDLEVSVLNELPGGRKPIQSSVVPEFKPTWIARAWEKMREDVAAGHQVYIVCPRIDGEGGVLETAEWLRATEFPNLHVDVLHGKMHAEEKDAVMSDFAAGGIDILVATTVIEVGVDVPNATVMMVRESEQFGVSQLHQLRGRVGRGGNQSLCLFHTLAEEGSDAFQRVWEVAQTSDGFALADLDLRHRREGDVLGTEQSGIRRTFKLIDLIEDYEIVTRAYRDAARFVEEDLEKARSLSAHLQDEDFVYLEKS